MAVSITNYSESAVNPCYFVDVTLEITGGTGIYDIYVNEVLTLENQTSPVTLNTSRGIPKTIAVLDSDDFVIGTAETLNSSQVSEIELTYEQNGSNYDLTVNLETDYEISSLYLYSLDDVTYQVSNEFTVSDIGTETVYVKDSIGCVKSKSIDIGNGLKYYFEFTDVKGIKHRCEIYNNDFFGNATEINGNLTTSKSATEDTLEVIRGGGLTINLEASPELTFEDFYTENERTFYVKYIRNSIEEFWGWLSPEGLYQSFVEDKWIISLYCTDGLGFLKNLSYVENDTGLIFTGKQSVLEVIVNCLKRTNLPQDIYTYTDVYYDGQTAATNTLAETYINANRFIKDDESTIMNCDEVLRSVFDIFGCCITQYRGSWVIFKPNSLKDDSSLAYYSYNSEGVALTPTQKELDFSFTLGSDINGFYPHHVNANQQLTIDSAIGAYRINYKYGEVFPFFENTELEWIDSNSIQDWTINDSSKIEPYSDLKGFLVEAQNLNRILVATSISYSLSVFASLELNLTYFSALNVPDTGTRLVLKVIFDDGSNLSYLTKQGVWTDVDTFIVDDINTNVSEKRNLKITSSETPVESGDIYIELYTNEVKLVPASDYVLDFLSIKRSEGIKKGENHTFQIITKPSSKIENTKEVYNGDSPDNAFIGTIYKADSTTPTETWNRGNVRKIPLLRYAGEERMAMYNKPLRIFIGDVFGYVNYLSVIEIDGFEGIKFMPIEYKYDALTNVSSLKLKEIYNDAGGIDYNEIDYELTYDYGTVVEPTIKG